MRQRFGVNSTVSPSVVVVVFFGGVFPRRSAVVKQAKTEEAEEIEIREALEVTRRRK